MYGNDFDFDRLQFLDEKLSSDNNSVDRFLQDVLPPPTSTKRKGRLLNFTELTQQKAPSDGITLDFSDKGPTSQDIYPKREYSPVFESDYSQKSDYPAQGIVQSTSNSIKRAINRLLPLFSTEINALITSMQPPKTCWHLDESFHDDVAYAVACSSIATSINDQEELNSKCDKIDFLMSDSFADLITHFRGLAFTAQETEIDRSTVLGYLQQNLSQTQKQFDSLTKLTSKAFEGESDAIVKKGAILVEEKRRKAKHLQKLKLKTSKLESTKQMLIDELGALESSFNEYQNDESEEESVTPLIFDEVTSILKILPNQPPGDVKKIERDAKDAMENIIQEMETLIRSVASPVGGKSEPPPTPKSNDPLLENIRERLNRVKKARELM